MERKTSKVTAIENTASPCTFLVQVYLVSISSPVVSEAGPLAGSTFSFPFVIEDFELVLFLTVPLLLTALIDGANLPVIRSIFWPSSSASTAWVLLSERSRSLAVSGSFSRDLGLGGRDFGRRAISLKSTLRSVFATCWIVRLWCSNQASISKSIIISIL